MRLHPCRRHSRSCANLYFRESGYQQSYCSTLVEDTLVEQILEDEKSHVVEEMVLKSIIVLRIDKITENNPGKDDPY